MFTSFRQEIESLISRVIADPTLHGRWLNTLSYLEHSGARKIAASAHPSAVKEERLKHAAEEFRHAHYLKTQLRRIGQVCIDYSRLNLLGGWATYHYLYRLDLFASRQNRSLAYLLTTYAIELRAAELYPLYRTALQKSGSKIRVQSILLEEEEHLAEMEKELSHVPGSEPFIRAVCEEEGRLCGRWLHACSNSFHLMGS